MPDNNIELKLTDDDVRYDLKNHIYIHTNLGNLKISFKDALEITHALLDGTYHLNSEIEQLLCEIEDDLAS